MGEKAPEPRAIYQGMKIGRIRGWTLYAAAWVPFTLLYIFATTSQGGVPFRYALISGICVMGVAALGGVLIWRVTGRLPVGVRWVAFYPLHLGLALGYAVGWTAFQLGWLWLVAGFELAWQIARIAGIWQVFTGLWIYALVAGVSYLIRTQRDLREREVAAARARTIAAEAQLQAVRSQLNPHFLFNSLHSLSALIRRDPELAEDAVDRLGELLRYALDHGSGGVVELRDELTFARNYLDLEALRFGDRLRTEFEIDDDLLGVVVPPFIVQPLVENAVRHGLAPRSGQGTIRIRTELGGGALLIEVSDDGLGIEGDSFYSGSIDELVDDDPRVPSQVRTTPRLGLRGVRQILLAHYGEVAELSIESGPGRGFLASISLPLSSRSAEVRR